MRTRWSAYAGVSAALAGGVVVKALAQRPNFYSAAVYLSQSSANLMVLTNFVFVAACTLLLGLQKLLYGPLRPIEIEQLYEKAWFAVTETCLAMTIFRGEIGAWFLVMFFALLAGKVWAWIGEGRVEILEQQPPRNPRLFHTRLALSLALSVMLDLTILEYIVKQVMHMAKPDMMVMFGFEFAVLSIVSLSTAARYAINLAEIAIVRGQKARRIDEIRRERVSAAVREVEQNTPGNEQPAATTEPTGSATAAAAEATIVPPHAIEAARRALQQPIDEQEIEVEGWEGKGRWMFYLDLATDFFKLVVYLSFFFILLIFYGLPIHILRDVFMTFRSFFKRIGDFMRYRTATRDMNARYPDATEQEIGTEEVCIICREEMRPYQAPANGERANPLAERMRPKKLPCGHILHFSCLRSWLERQQICPTCRTNVVTRSSTRTAPTSGAADGAAGQHGNAPPAERQGPRVYQLGPLRIGIGAARGNMLEDLQQQLGDGPPRPGQQPQGDGPQQYGFGIRWDGLRRRDRGERSSRSIQRQLDEVQRHISQEYRTLGQMTNELRLLRNMEAELARVRAQRQGGTAPATAVLPGTATTAPSNLPTVTALSGNLQNVIPSGSDRLPNGLTLPEGWSMMPLQPGFQPVPGQRPTVLPGGIPFGPNLVPPSAGPQAGPHADAPNPGQPVHPFPFHQFMHHNLMPNGVTVTAANGPGLPQSMAAQQGPSNQSTMPNPLYLRPASGQTPAQQTQPGTTPATTPTPGSYEHQLAELQRQSNRVARTTDNSASTQPTQPPSSNGGDEAPASSMFSPLPSWGSVSMQPSTSNRAANDMGGLDSRREQSNGTPVSRPGSSSTRREHSSGTLSSRKRNPTVEDLVEEPD